MPLEWMLMATLGVVMVLIFAYIRLMLYPRLVRAVAGGAWPAGGAALTAIRGWVMVNLALGVVTVAVAQLGVTG